MHLWFISAPSMVGWLAQGSRVGMNACLCPPSAGQVSMSLSSKLHAQQGLWATTQGSSPPPPRPMTKGCIGLGCREQQGTRACNACVVAPWPGIQDLSCGALAAICSYGMCHGPMGGPLVGLMHHKHMVCSISRSRRVVEPRSLSTIGIDTLAHTYTQGSTGARRCDAGCGRSTARHPILLHVCHASYPVPEAR